MRRSGVSFARIQFFRIISTMRSLLPGDLGEQSATRFLHPLLGFIIAHPGSELFETHPRLQITLRIRQPPELYIRCLHPLSVQRWPEGDVNDSVSSAASV